MSVVLRAKETDVKHSVARTHAGQQTIARIVIGTIYPDLEHLGTSRNGHGTVTRTVLEISNFAANVVQKTKSHAHRASGI